MLCFEPVLTIRAGRLLVDHRLGEGVHPVDDAPQIDPEHALPALVMVPRAAARRGAGIVHQHRDPAERGVGPLLKPQDLVHLADIGRHGDDGCARHLGLGAVERVLAQIGEADLHAQRGEPLRRRQADAARPAGDDRGAAFGQSRMHVISPKPGAACSD
jgi:hypothetical protein